MSAIQKIQEKEWCNIKNLRAVCKKAFEELEAIGAPVMHFDGGYSGNALFAVSAECNDRELWATYWEQEFGEFGVNMKVVNILSKHGLFCEWYNPAVLDVHII